MRMLSASKPQRRVGFRKVFAPAVRCLAMLILLLLPNFARPQESHPPASHQGDDYTIDVNVDMVVLHATVEDHHGALVSGIDKNDFQVFEDGVPQPIKYFTHEDIPVTVGLVVDNSGSMSPKRSDVIAAAMAFARSSNPLDQMFVVHFNEKVWFGLPDDIPFTSQTAELEDAMSRMMANGETALYDAVVVALERLEKGTRDKKVLIVVSDGGDNVSKHKLPQILDAVGRPDVIIYTIGIFDEQDEDRNPRVLRQLAENTGGEAFLPESLKDVAPICERIARDIRNQYTIAYVPTNRKRDGSYRAIQVKATTPGRGRLLVRTRTGYYAPPPPPPAKANDHAARN